MSPHTDAGALLKLIERLRAAATSFEGQRAWHANAVDGDCEPHDSWQIEMDDASKAAIEAADILSRQAASQGSTGNVVGWMARCSTTGGRLFAHTELTASLEGKLIYSEHGFTVEPLVVAASQGNTGGERNAAVEQCALKIEELAPHSRRFLAAEIRALVKTGGDAEYGGTTYSPIGRNADGIEVYKRDARPVDVWAREEIARIIDPNFPFWEFAVPNSFQQKRKNRALAKADAILALPKLTALGEDELYRVRDIIASHISCEGDCQKRPNGCGCALTAAREIVEGRAIAQARGNYEGRHPSDMVLHPLSEIREWDEALAVLGIQDSDQTPADAIRERDAEIERLRACAQASGDSGDLTKIAAECHRAKWQFDFNDEIKIGMPVARRALVTAFNELHRIGDMALKLRDASSVPSASRGTGISDQVARLALEVHERRAAPHVGPVGSDNDIRFLALAMAGEAGEAANVVKKAWRDGKLLDRAALAEEIAGTACYLIGLAAAINIDLSAEMCEQMAQFELRYSAVPSTNRETSHVEKA